MPPATSASAAEPAAPAPAGKSAKAGPVDRPPPASGEVLDLCALKPREDSTRFVKRRVVLFAPAGAASVEDDGAIAAAGGAAHLRDVFAARFPLDRFHNVVTLIEARKGWSSAQAIDMAQVRAHVAAASDTDAAVPKGSATDPAPPGTADEPAFVRYSIACADYLAVPAIVGHEVEWKDAEVKTKDGKTRKVKLLTLKLRGEIGIFRRDGASFQLVKTISASVPGLLDLATDATAGAIPEVEVKTPLGSVGLATAAAKTLKLPGHLSALPGAECKIAETASDGVAALARCAKQGTASGALAPGAIDERAGPICKKARAEGPPDEQFAAMVACEVRVRAFQLARALQKEARDVEGWKLFAPLQRGVDGDPESPAISLGREEGVKVGYGFHALSASGEKLAYFKSVSIGPGGENGVRTPTELSLRSGEARPGARLEEYPQLGLSVMPYAGGGLLTMNYGKHVVTLGDGTLHRYSLPPDVIGGGLNVGWTKPLRGRLAALVKSARA